MALYTTRIATPLPAAAAFDFVADLRRFAQWDPGVRAAVQVAGDGPGLGAAYDLTIASNGTVMRYVVREFAAPRRLVVEARTRWLHSYDVLQVEATGAGAVVRYDARLDLRGPLALGDRLLRPVFRRIGDAAAQGLAKALQGQIVA